MLIDGNGYRECITYMCAHLNVTQKFYLGISKRNENIQSHKYLYTFISFIHNAPKVYTTQMSNKEMGQQIVVYL